MNTAADIAYAESMIPMHESIGQRDIANALGKALHIVANPARYTEQMLRWAEALIIARSDLDFDRVSVLAAEAHEAGWLTPAHTVSVQRLEGARYPWVANCSCGWRTDWGYVAAHAAEEMASDHLGQMKELGE